MNSAVRKIHNLLSSGAVTMTGPNQPRILKQKVGGTTITTTGGGVGSHTISSNNLQQQSVNNGNRCYVCDEAFNTGAQQHLLTEMLTTHTSTKFPNKIGQLVGDAFMVIVSVEDVLCARCTNLINYLDRLENDVERVRTNLMNMLHKKYGLNDDGGGSSGGGAVSPPIKMQKMNSGLATRSSEDSDLNRTRKMTSSDGTVLGKQSPPVSAVQQIKISTQPMGVTNQVGAGTQTVQRKTTRIYKCLSCDYKTSDMRLFNTHYETCKQQNFQCKNCKKIFPNFGAMKLHMVREHNTAMDNTCAVCHINFVSEPALRKHMELNHSTNVVVTSTTTLPAGGAAASGNVVSNVSDSVASAPATGTTTSLYSCNHCQFKSTDKAIFDEHLRKHMQGSKPKPFKCRLCAQRFETREAATIHAKQHQPNYFKCGTCSLSFAKRELLVKHFEVHQNQGTVTTQQQQQSQQQITVKQQSNSQNLLTTQKLLQETIDEALSDSVGGAANATTDVATAAASNIRFFSCHICSLTFIQENYYNQHMETHRRDKKRTAGTTSASGVSNNVGSLAALNSAAQLLGDGIADDDKETTTAAGQQTVAVTSSQASISEADIESIFEKMHSDKSDHTAVTSTHTTTIANTNTAGASQTAAGNDNLVITSQEGSGGITFNITIPQPDGSGTAEQENESGRRTSSTSAPVNVSIDMPMLDQADEATTPNNNAEELSANDSKKANSAGPVSMPSLDDDNETTEIQTQEDEASKAEDAEKAEHVENKSAEDIKAEENEHIPSEEAEAQNEAANAENTAEDAAAAAESEAAGEVEHSAEHEGEHHVAMELDEAMQAQVESGQIKFILNENGQLLQLDNHIITDAEGNQILVQDPEQIQQLLQSVGVLQSGDGLDGETLQMMTDSNGQMVLVQGENNETQLIDASLLNAEGQLVIQQGQDGELGEGAHVIGEDGTRIPVSVSYTEDGQPIVQVQQHVMEAAEAAAEGEEKETTVGDNTEEASTKEANAEVADETEGSGENASGDGGGFYALEDLMQQSAEAKSSAE